METIIQGGTIINEGRAFRGDIVLEDDHIAALYEAEKAPRGIYQQTVDARDVSFFRVSLMPMYTFVSQD